MTLPKAIIIEIDGVLSDDIHRRHFISDQGDYDKKQDANLIKKILGDWKPDYEAYHAKCGEDEVNEGIVSILKFIAAENWADGCQKNDHFILFVTNRPYKYFQSTIKFIDNIGFYMDGDYLKLFMRPEFTDKFLEVPHPERKGEILFQAELDTRPSHIIKCQIYEREIHDKYEILFVIDKGEDAAMYRELGLTVLEVK